MEKDSSLKQVFGWIRVNGVLTFGRCSIARESGEPSKTEKLETASAGAFVNFVHPWHTVSWRAARGKTLLALMAFCGETLKPNGRQQVACADVVISHSH